MLYRKIVDQSKEQPRYGYRRVTALIRKDGETINWKRVQRVRRKECLQVSRKQRKMRRVGQSTALRQQADHPRHVWSWDFVEDQTENGSRFRILTIIDEYTRQWLNFYLAHSIRADDVITVLAKTMAKHGTPEHIRSDNGPEFIAYAVQDWLAEQQIKTLYIKPGSPWENAYIESFHDKIRDECLNREIFGNQLEARVIIESFRKDYNENRPHSSLGYLSPNEYHIKQKQGAHCRPLAPARGTEFKQSEENELAHQTRTSIIKTG
jgi:putative transposase